MLNRQKYDKWSRWMDVIRGDLTRTVNNQAIFYYINSRVVRGNSEHLRKISAETFLRFVKGCYTDAAISGVRRHVKVHKDSISLKGLLLEVLDESPNFKFSFYTKIHTCPHHSVFDWRWETFKTFSYGGKTVSPRLVRQHIDKLDRLGLKIEHIADRSVSHLDKRGVRQKVTYNDLKGAIRDLNEVACRYLALIKGDGYASLKPTILADWTEVFFNPLRKRP